MTEIETIGLLADIHSNFPALEAVLEDMPAVDVLVCAGDIIGYNAMPGECLEVIRDRCEFVVQGNHDRTVKAPSQYSFNQQAYEGLRLAQERLSSEQLDWLGHLPERQLLFDDRLLLVHSHPEQIDSYVYKGDFPEVSTYMEDHTKALVLGHTHEQAAVDMSQFDRHGIVVNPGSVGQPRDTDWRAAYAVLDLTEPTVDLRRAEYSREDIIYENQTAGLPDATSERLKL